MTLITVVITVKMLLPQLNLFLGHQVIRTGSCTLKL